ncbi:MAG: hypothetical protein KC910_28070 [Candidatus Eremiobacteraeota bacterium]|nr:hypothetical protein [Candidatus Eremiobacteraeota bacterium]
MIQINARQFTSPIRSSAQPSGEAPEAPGGDSFTAQEPEKSGGHWKAGLMLGVAALGTLALAGCSDGGGSQPGSSVSTTQSGGSGVTVNSGGRVGVDVGNGVSVNSDGSVGFDVGGGTTINSNGTVGFDMGGGVIINSDGTVGFKF